MTAERPVAFVSGTSRGVGRHLAQHLLREGYLVVGCSRSEPDALAAPGYSHRRVDVGSEPAVVELFRQIRGEYGRLDVVVSNAARNTTLSLAALTSGVAAREVLEANVLGTFLVCREAIKSMMRRGSGRIVNIGSMATRHEVAGEALYTASKAAVNAMTRVLAKEVAQYGITCNVLAPAALETEGMGRVDPVHVQALLERNAQPRIGAMEEVAAAIDWLISPAASAITGQIVYLGGA